MMSKIAQVDGQKICFCLCALRLNKISQIQINENIMLMMGLRYDFGPNHPNDYMLCLGEPMMHGMRKTMLAIYELNFPATISYFPFSWE